LKAGRKRNNTQGGGKKKGEIILEKQECLLVIQALDGADVGADDSDLGGGVHGALPQQRLARLAPAVGAAVVVAEQGLGGAVVVLAPRRRRGPGAAVHALDVVVVVAPLPLRPARRRPRGVAVAVHVHWTPPRLCSALLWTDLWWCLLLPCRAVP